MSDTVIKVENLSKQYRLGKIGTGTLSHDLNRWWAGIRGKEDPYLKIGFENKISLNGGSEYVWALRNVNFEVRQGDVLGIIGKNGAGKSTILKILSRVTSPTLGEVKIKGRIASLLEVGTGFHPELTGRENIFLNGAILGMTKNEIRKQFDEIVDFSGVEKYIDTPVKRYSSGMYVRLAFAVAAHLEPEILIVDEVLAVGDAEFQKKCLGKMKDVSLQGRTVLFVSHNMPSLRALCNKGIFLKNGTIEFSGTSEDAITKYLQSSFELYSEKNGIEKNIPEKLSKHNSGDGKFRKAFILNEAGEIANRFFFREKLKINLEFEVHKKIEDANVLVGVVSKFGETIASAVSDNEQYKRNSFEKGLHKIELLLNTNLMPDSYALRFSVFYFHTGSSVDVIEYFYPFEVLKETKAGDFEYPWATVHGYIEPLSEWQIQKV
ncbi:MAG: ABC transporter ATP-binding protein [Bacteroidetes bacterium]|nr:ABC transporter ATP-binding protein [Bacteroidota bacterium]